MSNDKILGRWKESEFRRSALEDSFPAFHKRVFELASVSAPTGIPILRVVPRTLQQIAREAEKTNEFDALVEDIFGDPSEFEKLKFAELVRRSGYYAWVFTNEPSEPLWSRVVDRVPGLSREIRYLRLLDGCSFPRGFSICDHEIVRLTPAELDSLGPAGGDFFPNERLRAEKFSESWFLGNREETWTGVLDIDTETRQYKIVSNVPAPVIEEFAAGRERFAPSKGQRTPTARLGDHVLPILVLMLYRDEYFEVPLTVICEPGWRLLQYWSQPIRRWEVRYSISEPEFGKFQEFAAECTKALDRTRADPDRFRPLIVGARHYLRASFSNETALPPWEDRGVLIDYPEEFEERHPSERYDDREQLQSYEEALLSYVFCLEGLLSGDDSGAINYKLGTNAALLVGQNDDEREFVRRLVTDAYDIRSKSVHGASSKKQIELSVLRRLCQRVLGMALFQINAGQPEDLADITRCLAVSDHARAQMQAIRTKFLKLIPDPAPLFS